MNQTNAILAHLKSGASITSMEAIEAYGVTRLSAKIFDIKKQGYNVQYRKHKITNRFGNTSCYKEYFLVDEGDENK